MYSERLPSDGGFTLAFGVCAAALAAGVVSALITPRATGAARETQVAGAVAAGSAS